MLQHVPADHQVKPVSRQRIRLNIAENPVIEGGIVVELLLININPHQLCLLREIQIQPAAAARIQNAWGGGCAEPRV
jgi:hypothetical protein